MNFKDAMELLKSGKKITRGEFREGLFIQLQNEKIKSYRPNIVHYRYDGDIILSKGWTVCGEKDIKDFCDIIEPLRKGFKVKLSEWPDESFIYLDRQDGLVFHSLREYDFIPDVSDFLAHDWKEV